MAGRGKRERAALGFSVHTGWAAVVAVSFGSGQTVVVLERRRVEMIPGKEPEQPPYVYHAAATLAGDAAHHFVRRHAESSRANATAALGILIEELAARQFEVVANGLLGSNQPLTATLDTILASHTLIHAAEGEMFRDALRRASTALDIPVTEIRPKELQARAGAALGIPVARVPQRLTEIGRGAGPPWAKDQKNACLMAVIALRAAN